MRKTANKSDRLALDDTESLLRKTYPKLVKAAFEKGDITEAMKETLLAFKPIELDELDIAYKELVRVLENPAMYKLIDRIETADQVIAVETDKAKRDFYVLKRNELAKQLERMDPA